MGGVSCRRKVYGAAHMKFSYFGRELEGFDHLYNSTYLNERQVELAVAVDFLSDADSTNVLEVGNVLAHYDIGGHVVVDRYEAPTGYQVLMDWPYYQVDVFDIATQVGSSWDRIVAISTLEHVGFDLDPDAEVDTEASMRAIAYLRTLLAPQGRMLVTLPCGFHPVLDDLITEDLLGAERSCTFVRDWDAEGDEPGWVQTDEPTVLLYGDTNPWAEAVWVGEFARLN